MTSSTKIFLYNTSDQSKFQHNEDELIIDINGARFRKLALVENEMWTATAKLQANADRSINGNVNVFFRGAASWNSEQRYYDLSQVVDNSYLSLNDDTDRDGVDPLYPTSHFDFKKVGTVRFKFKKPYNGAPPETYYIATSGNSVISNGLGGLWSFRHEADGDLILNTRAPDGVEQLIANFGNWVPGISTIAEFEIDYDSENEIAYLFINGALLGSGAVVDGEFVRDFFYFGQYYTENGFKSSCYVYDIEIFDSVQHTEDFTDEIPRVVRIYANNSLIVPTDYSTAEAFDNLEDEVEVDEDGACDYILKVENDFYYVVGTTIFPVVNFIQGETSTAAEFVAAKEAITAFIQPRARITFCPMPYSGIRGDANFLLKSTTLDYDFSDVPATCEKCTLFGFLDNNCKSIVSGTVKVYTAKPIYTQGRVESFIEEVPAIAPNGEFEMPLVIPNLPFKEGRKDDFYYLDADWKDQNGVEHELRKVKIVIPPQATVQLDEEIIIK